VGGTIDRARAAVDEAKIGIDKAKFQWDTSEAKLALEIRANPGDFGLDKVTEGTITAAVKDHKKYKKARQKWIDAKANADATTARAGKLEQAVKTMEMKKRMLESLITLHGQQYFAGPSTPRDLPAAWLAQKAAAEEASHKRQVSVTRKRKKKAK